MTTILDQLSFDVNHLKTGSYYIHYQQTENISLKLSRNHEEKKNVITCTYISITGLNVITRHGIDLRKNNWKVIFWEKNPLV